VDDCDKRSLITAKLALDVLGVDPTTVPVVTRDEVQDAKPDQDLFIAAANRLGVDVINAIVVGDSIWDLLAARRARSLGVGLLSGGYAAEELERAGAYRFTRTQRGAQAARRNRTSPTLMSLDLHRAAVCPPRAQCNLFNCPHSGNPSVGSSARFLHWSLLTAQLRRLS
jgi:Haloacid dehalogenase-like hydrolase